MICESHDLSASKAVTVPPRPSATVTNKAFGLAWPLPLPFAALTLCEALDTAPLDSELKVKITRAGKVRCLSTMFMLP